MLWTSGSIRIGICGGTILCGGGWDGCCDGAAVCIGPVWMGWPLCIGCVVIADVTTAGTDDGGMDVVAVVWLLTVAMLELVAVFAFAFACITKKDIMQLFFFDIRLVIVVFYRL